VPTVFGLLLVMVLCALAGVAVWAVISIDRKLMG
jgi:hypothetical protein